MAHLMTLTDEQEVYLPAVNKILPHGMVAIVDNELQRKTIMLKTERDWVRLWRIDKQILRKRDRLADALAEILQAKRKNCSPELAAV